MSYITFAAIYYPRTFWKMIHLGKNNVRDGKNVLKPRMIGRLSKNSISQSYIFSSPLSPWNASIYIWLVHETEWVKW